MMAFQTVRYRLVLYGSATGVIPTLTFAFKQSTSLKEYIVAGRGLRHEGAIWQTVWR